jgi:hypothetical protein
MKGPNDLEALSTDEERKAKELQKEIEDHFREAPPGVNYTFDPETTGALEFNNRVRAAVIGRARKAGWTVEGDTNGFTVSK